MQEIALAMEGIGLTQDTFQGAAAIYEMVDAVFNQKGYSEGPPLEEILTLIENRLSDHGD